MGILIFLWKAYRDYCKDKLQEERDREKVEADREMARQGRLDRGFGALDESRDRHVARLTAEAEAAERRHSAERDRWSADLERQARKRTAEDRDEGWDRGRSMEWVAHQRRHDFTNLLGALLPDDPNFRSRQGAPTCPAGSAAAACIATAEHGPPE